MTIRFYLRCYKEKGGDCSIWCTYSHEGKKWAFKTGLKINKNQWTKKQRAKGELSSEINLILDQIENDIKKKALGFLAKGQNPTASLMKSTHNKGGKGFYKMAREDFEKVYLMGKSPGYKYIYSQLFKELESYAKTRGKLTFDLFDQDFLFHFTESLKKKENTQSTIHKKFTFLRVFLNYSAKKGLNDNMNYKTWRISRGKPGEDEIALTQNEIEMIANYNGMYDTRDLFVFMCHTGLRYSDAMSIESGSVFNNTLHYTSPKTGKNISLPLSEKALSIIRLYNNAPPKISIDKYNKEIKLIGKGAGLNEEVVYKGKRRKMYELLKSHTARRSFVTIMSSKVPVHLVSKIIGHSSVTTTEGYNKTNEGLKYNAVREVWG